jgi:hypothetical protein
MNLRLLLPGIAVTLAAAAACSSSSSPAPAGATNNDDGGTDTGASDDSGSTQGTGDTGAAATPAIMCGSATCSAPASSLFPLSPCCLPDNSCGATFGSAALAMFDAGAFDASGLDLDAGSLCIDTAPGTPDTACPSQSAMGFTLAGCCTRSGVCGNDLSLAGLGCDSLSALGALAPGGSAGDAAIAAPQACGGDAAAPADAGGAGADASPTGDGSTP